MIKYSNFCDAFAPKEESSLKLLASRVPRNVHLTMPYEEMFSDKTREMFKEVWHMHIDCER